MVFQSKILFKIHQRTFCELSKLLCNKRDLFSNNRDPSQNSRNKNAGKTINYMSYMKYAVMVTSVFGMYYYYNSRLKKVYALNKPSKCGEFRTDLNTITWEELGKHDNKQDGIWVSFKRGVYDITKFVEKHPGGSSKILMAAGSSIEPFWEIFDNHNTHDIHLLLESMRIGNISKEDSHCNNEKSTNPYENEPTRHKVLKINGSKPFCAEPPSSILTDNFYTPNDFFYVRNHLPVPEIDLTNYNIELAVEDTTRKTLSLDEIKKYPKYTITSAIQCGGNRRSEMAEIKPLRGLSWGVGAIGNATWTGARLCDILHDLGINETHYRHVQFEGHDLDPSGMPYGASIPITKAMNPKSDVIIAYEMNGQPIPRDHGFPLRVVVPGVVGARSVKWLAKIVVSEEESPSQWQQGDYKSFSPSVDWENVDFSKSPAIQEMPVTSAICTPTHLENVIVKDGKINVQGYAWSGGGNKIIRVDVTCDGGDTWYVADLTNEDVGAQEGRNWSWTLWNIKLPVDQSKREIEIWAKAIDSSYNVQPESFKNIWNLRGLLSNAYHRVKVKLNEHN